MNRKNHVYRSLTRVNQFWGCDRELAMMLLLVCVAIAVLCADLTAALIAMSCLCLGFVGLRSMARTDPLFRQVYLRALRYRRVYRAAATLDCPLNEPLCAPRKLSSADVCAMSTTEPSGAAGAGQA